MDFSLTEEQTMLKDSVNRFLEKNFSFEQRRKMLADRQPMNAQLWAGLASLGVLGVPFSPDDGGFGGGGVETMLVMEALGYDGPVVTDPSKPDGTPRKLMDNARLTALGWAPKTELREGIAKSYAAFLSGEGRGL